MDYRDKKVLFTAFSVGSVSEEVSLYNYLKSQGVNDISALYWGGEEIASQIPDDVNKIPIDSPTSITPELVAGYDVVFRHPPTRPDALGNAIVSSLTQEFFDKCPAPIIGVTGTKGKGTTSTLIAKILEASGKKVFLVGNIGNPPLDVLSEITADDFVVHELSSFQLWDITRSPRVAVVLMIEPDHMDVHKDMDEYVTAKSNIAKYQTLNDWVYYHPTNELSAKIASSGQGNRQPYMSQSNAYVQNEKIYLEGKEVCETREVALLGKHNLENICAALAAASQFTDNIEAMRKVLLSFSGLDHRLQLVAEVEGVKYIDDSISTTPSTAIAAIRAFSQPKILIAGGAYKGLEYDALAQEIAQQDLKHVILLGITGPKIQQCLDAVGYTKYSYAADMHKVIELAQDIAESDDVVLLSPASSSFDMFANYKDRGDQFKQAAGAI